MEVSDHQSLVFSGTIRSTYYNIALQIFCKLVTFALNGLILRYISKELLGIVNVRLLLINTTILFLCREGIRRACAGNIQNRDWKQTVNLIWTATAFSVVVSVLLGILWAFAMENPDAPFYGIGVIAFAASSVVEMIAEPISVLAQEFMYLKLRVFAKFIGLTIQSILNAILIIVWPDLGILIFAGTQLLGSVIYTGIFYIYFAQNMTALPEKSPAKEMKDFLPSVSIRPFFPERLKPLALSFTYQSFLKQLLTEGERFIMSAFQMLSFAEQGIFDLVNNLGSLVARLFFQQVEENAYVLFSKVLARKRDRKKADDSADAFGSKMLEVYLKVVTSASVIIICFGFCYSDVILSIYGGKNMGTGSAPELMRTYWFYVLFLAINGVTEAFVFSAMTKPEVDRYNKALVVFSFLFLLCAWIFVKACGSVGFIYANILNMGLRIAHSLHFIHYYYKDTAYAPLSGILISKAFLASVIVAFISINHFRFYCNLDSVSGNLVFLAVGAFSGVLVLLTFWLTERETLSFIFDLLRKRKADSLKKDSLKNHLD